MILQIAPSHEGLELGIGDSILVKVSPCLVPLCSFFASHCVLLGISIDLPQPILPMLLCSGSASCHAVRKSLCLQALAQATGKSMQKVKAEYDKEGDLGTVAANARSSQKTMFQSAPLTVRAVFK